MVHSFTDSDLPDSDIIVPFEYTTPINHNKKAKKKNAEQIDQINWCGIFEGYNVVSVRQIWVSKQTRPYIQINKKIDKKNWYSKGSREVPTN